MKMPFRDHPKKEILVVDDTPDNLRLLSAILTKRNYEVRKALNSKHAISSVKADAPDLILLDIKMPETDGYETCMALKRDPATEAIPIIFISALDDALDKVRAFSVGGADYISKPFQEAEVLARIENQLYLRDLQLQLETQNQALVQSNQELEQFAYIVSHDLQQPLQTIIGYAKIINLQHSSTLDQDVVEYLEKISAAGNRMHRLINNLLSYATIEEGKEDYALVDCNVVLAEAVSNLQMMIQETHASLNCPKLPFIYGKESQLVQLFQNLIGNAIKFNRPKTQPCITLNATLEPNGFWLFTFQDNGIGIPPEKIATVFQKFHRLHSSEEYSGSGIGLATCKKIVENHFGEIWAESVLGEGSTFFVRLPSDYSKEQ